MPEISYSRQQYLAELAAGKAGRAPRGINPESEDAIQANFFEWIDLQKAKFPELELFFSIPNGSNKSKTVRWVMKLTGLRPGVPDVHLPLPSFDEKYIGLFLEFKAKTGVLSPAQKVWIERLRRAGHRVEIVRSWVDAANISIEHLNIPLEKL